MVQNRLPCAETEAAQSNSAENLKLTSIQSRATVKRVLDAARRMAGWGVPIFLARPDRDAFGQWRAGEGHNKTGYWLPKEWQLTKPDPAVVDRWQPGMALCAVMGTVVDLLDTDPRNGGDATRQGLVESGSWPTIYWQAATPSGGLHDFVKTLGVPSRDNVRPGLDIKAGKDGHGHGFAFIAPTIRASKTTGDQQPYRWIIEPTTAPPITGDNSGQPIADLLTHQRARPVRASLKPKALASWLRARLDELPDEEPCAAMKAQTDLVAKGLANGKRHAATLGPVIQLVRLGREGHRGLLQALSALSQDFVSRVSDARAGGAAEALQEWDRSLVGALMEVLGEHGRFPLHRACDCILRQFRIASKDPTLFTCGAAGLTERRVMGYLIESARLGRSVVVAESQRQIAEAIDQRQATVGRTLKRLERLGWLRPLVVIDRLAPTPLLLLLPEVCSVVSTQVPAVHIDPLPTAGTWVDTNTHNDVHRLFGSQGLGPGPSETFSSLPEHRILVTRGYLAQVMPGSQSSPLLTNPWQGKRQIPHDPGDGGRTVLELAYATGKNRSTVAKHLKKLHDRGLAFSVQEHGHPPRWWRYRFDPDWVADRNQIPHTGDIKAAKHAEDRIAFLDARIRWAGDRESSRLIAQDIDGDRFYIDSSTGAVEASVPIPTPQERKTT